MTTSMTASPAGLLSQVAGERQTGALVVGGQPGGAVYVLDGRVIYAESPAAPGVGELLTSSGRLAGRTWQNALDRGTSTARVGRLLVEAGHLTQGELELCTLGATYDAAYFALAPDAAPVRFLEGATHWLGAVVAVDPTAVAREAARRIRLLDDIFPDARVDTAPVSPTPRAPRERVTLTALQWELLVHADGQRTPADLAQLLGRAGFATIQELRRLAALGLLELPEVRAESPAYLRLPRARGTAVAVRRPVFSTDDVPTVPVVSGVHPVKDVPSVPVVSGVRPAVPAAPGGSDPPGPAPPGPVPPHAPAGPVPPHAPAGPVPPHAPAGPVPPHAPAGPVPPHAPAGPAAADPVPAVGDSPAGLGLAGEPAAGVYRPPKLARRKPGAKLPKEFAAEPPQTHPGTDEVLLKRIRTALRALR